MYQEVIYIIEDNILISSFIKDFLNLKGYKNIRQFESGIQALNCSCYEQPDMLITDINLHTDLNGLDIARLLQKKHYMPIIIISGEYYNTESADFQELDNYSLLPKPFRMEQLYSTMQSMLKIPV